jgi:Zn-dependent peptidase ImmA (M78 family)
MQSSEQIAPVVRFVLMLKKIQQVRNHYKQYILGGDGVPISLKDLMWVIGDMYDIKVSIYEVDYVGEFTRGLIERYADRARILIRAGIHERLRKFVVAKELSHIIIDEREDWSPLGSETIRKAMIERASLTELHRLSPSTMSETYAHAAAIELLYPLEYREDDAVKLQNGELTLQELADHYQIPPFLIEHALGPSLKIVMELSRLSA